MCVGARGGNDEDGVFNVWAGEESGCAWGVRRELWGGEEGVG